MMAERLSSPATPVTSPDYWCARLHAVVAAELPATFESQGRTLVARLDALRTRA